VAVEYDHLFTGTQNNAFTAVAAGNLGVNARNDDIGQDVDVVTRASTTVSAAWSSPNTDQSPLIRSPKRIGPGF
jgi:hypothetical protein